MFLATHGVIRNNSGGYTFPTGGVNYWTANNTPNDSIGTANGTLVGGMGYALGAKDYAFSFDGVNDYVSLPTNSIDLTGDFSISLTFNSAVNNGYYVLLSNYLFSVGLNYGFKIDLRLDNTIRFAIYNGGGGSIGLFSTTTFSTNTWYNVVITRKSGTRTRMYINGVINASDTNIYDPTYTGTNYPTMGVSEYQSGVFEQYATAKQQKIAIFNRELTAYEAMSLYQLAIV